MEKCCLCGSQVETGADYDYNIIQVKCPVCGYYNFDDMFYDVYSKDEVATYLYHKTIEDKAKSIGDRQVYYFGSEARFNKRLSMNKRFIYVSSSEVHAFFPRRFSERIDKFLISIDRKSEYVGQAVQYSQNELMSAFMLKRKDGFDSRGKSYNEQQIEEIHRYLIEQKYVAGSCDCMKLLPAGLMRIDDFQTDETNNKEVFVAMSFAEETKQIREAIRQSIINTGYSPTFIDEVKHGEQIVPEMLRHIKECRFFVIDISYPNFGAYYEAGYAQGLGKKVFVCCNIDQINREYTGEEKKIGKYLRPHFDIAQKQMILWKDTEELTHTLSEWIRVLIG